MSNSNNTGFGRVAAFVLVALALLALASSSVSGGIAPAFAFAGLEFAALALAVHRRHPAGVRVALMVGILLGAVLIPQFLVFAWGSSRERDNGGAIALSAAVGLLALLPVSMIVTSAAALRRLRPSVRSWLAALGLLFGATALVLLLFKVGARLHAPDALDGIQVHKLSFAPDGRELTAASEYAADANVFSVPDGRFVRAEKVSGIEKYRVERRAYPSDDGKLALEISYDGKDVDSLAIRDAAGKVLWTRRIGMRDRLARGSSCCVVGAAAFSPDNGLVAIAYFSTVCLYDARSGAEVAVMQGPTRKRVEASFLWWNVVAGWYVRA